MGVGQIRVMGQDEIRSRERISHLVLSKWCEKDGRDFRIGRRRCLQCGDVEGIVTRRRYRRRVMKVPLHEVELVVRFISIGGVFGVRSR